ncbi:hypothetical protein EXN66_Car012989 [Channa argus]|uniref:Uncharacterized protein n=1 Tax=Channa argus TaxID=215402 RepID=A0A6G1Q4D9_CHAAH|nr:hypothetical protein EXN66_Car012989 [Channa argus]
MQLWLEWNKNRGSSISHDGNEENRGLGCLTMLSQTLVNIFHLGVAHGTRRPRVVRFSDGVPHCKPSAVKGALIMGQ